MLDIELKNILKEEVEKSTGFHYNDIVSVCRIPELVKARDLIIWFLFTKEKMCLSSIGRFLDKDHSTIASSLKRIKKDRRLKKSAVLLSNKIIKRYDKHYKKNL